MNCYEWWWKC